MSLQDSAFCVTAPQRNYLLRDFACIVNTGRKII